MTASDVFVMASSMDPSPKAMSEALFLGLPVVCSDRVGTCDDLVSERNGFAYPCGDVPALAARLAELADPALRQRLSQGSRAVAAENDFRAATRLLIAKLDELAAGLDGRRETLENEAT